MTGVCGDILLYLSTMHSSELCSSRLWGHQAVFCRRSKTSLSRYENITCKRTIALTSMNRYHFGPCSHLCTERNPSTVPPQPVDRHTQNRSGRLSYGWETNLQDLQAALPPCTKAGIGRSLLGHHSRGQHTLM